MIELIEVTKNYDGIQALKEVSFTVSRGELLTLLGPNGSGKTTLLKILAALEMPSSGAVYFDGVKLDASRTAEIRQRATLVFQKTVVLRGSVRDNVEYGLRTRNASKKNMEYRVEKTLELVGLSGFESRSARTLSGGEQQRLSLARALVLDCDLLLLDEPTSNLDPESQMIVRDVVKRLNDEKGYTVVIATHDITQAENLSERIVLLDRGKVVEVGKPQELLRTPSAHMLRYARSENVFTGVSRVVEGISFIEIGPELEVKSASTRSGRVVIHISPESIIVSKKKMDSSARNLFKGRITTSSDHGGIVKLKIDVGRVFTVQITKRSFTEMGLNVGSEVYLVFKASAVRFL